MFELKTNLLCWSKVQLIPKQGGLLVFLNNQHECIQSFQCCNSIIGNPRFKNYVSLEYFYSMNVLSQGSSYFKIGESLTYFFLINLHTYVFSDRDRRTHDLNMSEHT